MTVLPFENDYIPPGNTRRKFVLEPFESIKFDAHEEWLVKRLLPRRGVAVLYGKSQSFKSFIVSDLAWHIAAGWDWAGLRVLQVPVVYIAAEGAEGLRKRKEGWTLCHEQVPSPLPFYLIADAPNLGNEKGDLPDLIASIEGTGIKPGLIAIDTLAQTIGSQDENGAGMVAYVTNAQALARHFDALVIPVHHVGLGDDQRLRGHSSLHGAVDAQLLCERKPGMLISTVRLQKLKDEDSSKAFDVVMSRVVINHDEDGEEISTLVVESIGEERDGKAATPRRCAVPAQCRLLMDSIVKTIDENGISLQPFGFEGLTVKAAKEIAIRNEYRTRLAEKAAPDEDPKKFAARQYKAFARAISTAINRKLIAASEHRGERVIWII
jgi:hypothetical protein